MPTCFTSARLPYTNLMYAGFDAGRSLPRTGCRDALHSSG